MKGMNRSTLLWEIKKRGEEGERNTEQSGPGDAPLPLAEHWPWHCSEQQEPGMRGGTGCGPGLHLTSSLSVHHS